MTIVAICFIRWVSNVLACDSFCTCVFSDKSRLWTKGDEIVLGLNIDTYVGGQNRKDGREPRVTPKHYWNTHSEGPVRGFFLTYTRGTWKGGKMMDDPSLLDLSWYRSKYLQYIRPNVLEGWSGPEDGDLHTFFFLKIK